MSLSTQIIEAADTSDGASREEILALTGKKYTLVDTKLQNLVKQAKIVRARVHGHPSRYFTSQAHADAWLSKQTPIPSVKEQIRAVYESNPEAGYSARQIYPLLVYCSKRTVTAAMRELAQAGDLVVSHHPVTKDRYFISDTAAAEYALLPAPEPKPRKFKVATPSTAARARSSRPKAASKDTREVIFPAGLVVQVGPCAEVASRYQLTSKDVVPSVFRSLPLGATLYGMTA